MKSAYELAMERLSKADPVRKLTAEQKQQLAELDSIYAAKLAEREIFLKGELEKAVSAGDEEACDQLRRQIASERRVIEAQREEKKEQVRQAQG